MTITELIEKRNKAWNAAKAFVETKRDADGILSDEDAKTYAEMEQKVKSFSAEIERMQAMDAMERDLLKPTSAPITDKPMSGKSDGKAKTGTASDEYKEAMLQAIRTKFHTISNVMQEGVDADGGYLVPDEYDNRLIEKLKEENIFRKLCHPVSTSGDHKINIAASTPAAAWIEEGEALTWGDATFAQILLDAHKLHVAIKVTEELLYDSKFDLETFILNAFSKALANAEENAFINGTGSGQPLGILAATGGADVGVTAASATAITADEIINLVYSLKRPYRKNAVFLMNAQTVAAVRKLKDGTGTYLWHEALTADAPNRLLGYPVFTSEFMPTIEAGAKTIAFGDFDYYNIGDRGSRSFQELKELFAGNGMVGFVAKERVDGKLILPEAIKVLQMKA